MGGAAATVDEASAMAGGGARVRPAAGTPGSLPTPAATGPQGDAAWLALCAIARWHQVAADPASLAHQLGLAPSEPVRVPDLLRAAALLGLKARLVRTRADRLSQTPLPALAVMGCGEACRRRDAVADICVLAQCDGSRVLLSSPRATAPDAATAANRDGGGQAAGPRIEPLEVFASRWSGQLILVTSRASVAGALARFDFSWFVPALVRYRRLLGEVLLVSFMLQLLALVSPLFFQVVMDKVLVHKAMTTLDVLVAGLLVVVVFESVLGAVRNYVLARGHGSDTIHENDSTPGNTDVAAFVGDIAADQLWFRRLGSSLEVSVIGTADRFMVNGWYNGSASRVEEFRTGDGRILLDGQVQALVDAMASFAPPPMGQLVLSDTLAAPLAPVIAANWH